MKRRLEVEGEGAAALDDRTAHGLGTGPGRRGQRGVVAGAGGDVLPERCPAVPALAVPPRVEQEVLDRNALRLERSIHRDQRVGVRAADPWRAGLGEVFGRDRGLAGRAG